MGQKWDTNPKTLQRRKQIHRKSGLKKYGLTPEEYAVILDNQDGLCAICNSSPKESLHGVLAVDHCHKSGKMRGLLCNQCNLGLGCFDDSYIHLQNALEYLNAPKNTSEKKRSAPSENTNEVSGVEGEDGGTKIFSK